MAKRAMIIPFCLMASIAAGQEGEPPAVTALEVKASGTKTFYVDIRAGNNQVSVFSESMLEDFTAVCNKVGGHCTLDPKKVESLTGRFVLRIADLRTGIDLRDEHLRSSDWLDAANHPEIVIAVDRIERAEKITENSARMLLLGTCSLHGQTRDVRIPATLVYLDETPKTMRRVKGDLIRIRANFELRFSDYGVTGPKGSDIIGLKVADTLAIKITVFGSTEVPPRVLTGEKESAPADGSEEAIPKRSPPRRPGGK